MSALNQPSQVERFVQRLTGLLTDTPANKATLAQLRRAAAEGPYEITTLRLLGNELTGLSNAALDSYRLVAVLFALHAPKGIVLDPKTQGWKNFGHSVGQLKESQPGERHESGPLDARFEALLESRAEDLSQPLRQLIMRMAACHTPIGINYVRLLYDLLNWKKDENIRLEWARAYWTPRRKTTEPEILPATDDILTD